MERSTSGGEDATRFEPQMGQHVRLITGWWSQGECNRIQRVVSRIFIGNYIASRSADELRRHRITHAVGIRDPQERLLIRPLFPDFITYQFVEAPYNVGRASIIPHFYNMIRILEELLAKNPDIHILVYCMDGIERSPSFITAYLMQKYRLSVDNAVRWVQNHRYCAQPSSGNYNTRLVEFEPFTQLSPAHACPEDSAVTDGDVTFHHHRRYHEVSALATPLDFSLDKSIKRVRMVEGDGESSDQMET
ncbi:hypothetical protein EV182_005935 [Spiromyces aspiralis]|uniref:Uncharacterized protein n=1 Tax=Spiromyces aspiralis TaxID=68401 RepID=A0ACC1H9B7_9FUNG|nr:hypothetical protein EV182_005935 [Spiromyces aspiralis]